MQLNSINTSVVWMSLQAWVCIYLQRKKRMNISGRELAYSVRILYNAFPSTPSFWIKESICLCWRMQDTAAPSLSFPVRPIKLHLLFYFPKDPYGDQAGLQYFPLITCGYFEVDPEKSKFWDRTGMDTQATEGHRALRRWWGSESPWVYHSKQNAVIFMGIP